MDLQGWGLRSAGGYAVNVILGVTSGHDPSFGGEEAGSGNRQSVVPSLAIPALTQLPVIRASRALSCHPS